MQIRSVAIVGMGALGMLYGDLLLRSPEPLSVGFVADAERRARYGHAPVTVNGRPVDFPLLPAERAAAPADLVIFATKATGFRRAMEDAAPYVGDATVLLSLLNGVTSEQQLADRFGRQKVAGCVAQGMDARRVDRGLTYWNPGVLCVGALEPFQAGAADAVCGLLERAGVPFRREADMRTRLWSKFMLNVGVNQVVMVFEGTYGTIQKPGRARDMMIGAMEEARQAAIAEGADVSKDELTGYVALLDTLDPDSMPSMRQDGLAKRPSEVELFSGTVLALAEKHGLDVPINRWLYETIQKMEAAY